MDMIYTKKTNKRNKITQRHTIMSPLDTVNVTIRHCDCEYHHNETLYLPGARELTVMILSQN